MKNSSSIFTKIELLCVFLIVVMCILTSCSSDASKNSTYFANETDTASSQIETKAPETGAPETEAPTSAPATNPPATQAYVKPTEDNNVSREYRNALQSAYDYLDTMPFSKQGLYDQLTSEYGGQFPADAAQYAIDNVNTDWKENAVKEAENYLDTFPMSRDELYDQLVSEYGGQYTPEEAQYAVDQVY